MRSPLLIFFANQEIAEAPPAPPELGLDFSALENSGYLALIDDLI